MPAFLESIFGRKKPTAAAAGDALAERKAEFAAIPGRIAAVDAKLKRVADLNDAEHEAALAELAALQRALVRVGAQVDDLEKAHQAAQKAEQATALRRQAEAADQAIRRDYPAALAEYEAAASLLAEKAAKLEELDGRAIAANHAIRQARKADPTGDHPDFVKSSTERYRTEPDMVEPDQETVETHWRFPDGRSASVFVEHEGKSVPQEYGAKPYKVPRTNPGRVRKGRVVPAPQALLVLPATRLGGNAHWPRRA